MITGKVVRLQPNKEQIQLFLQFSGTNRYAWNECKSYYDKVFKEEKRYVTLSDMMKHLQDLKHNNTDYTWLNDVPEAITKQAIKDLLKAYQKFYKDRKKNSSKDHDKYKPKYKKKGKCEESFYQRTDKIHKTDDSHIKITGIKKPVKCSNLKGIDLPQHIQNPRIKFDGKYWYLSYSYEVKPEQITFERETLGVDLGIKDLAIFSNGEHHRNINKDKTVKTIRKRLKHIQRQISRKYEVNAVTDKTGKKLYHKTKNIEKLEQVERLLYRRISNIQETYMYEVINSAVRTKPQTIVLEDLNVKGMLKNPRLARAIQEEKLSKFRQILTYKCKRYEINLVIADRYYPSSKTCSSCGNIKHNLKLSDRIYKCECCGLTIDRDYNAALNLENYPKIKYKSKVA